MWSAGMALAFVNSSACFTRLAMPTDQQALLGIQVLRALGSVRIGKQEKVEVGVKPNRSGTWTPLAFDQAIPVLQLKFEDKPLNFTFDTGAERTTLNASFASAFPRTVELGEKKQHKLTGVGGSTKQDAIEIPHLTSHWRTKTFNFPQPRYCYRRLSGQAPGRPATLTSISSGKRNH
jgi:hypothetical protein